MEQVAEYNRNSPIIATARQLLSSVSVDVSDKMWWQYQQTTMASAVEHGFSDMNKGGGGFCMGVLDHELHPKMVFKLCSTDSDYDGYILYARWVFENRVWEWSPHVPRIFDILESEEGGVALVVMERLEEITDWTGVHQWVQNEHGLAYRELTGKDVSWYRVPRSYKNDAISDVCQQIKSAFPEHRIDLHRGNVMLRDGIHMVIIDPITGLLD